MELHRKKKKPNLDLPCSVRKRTQNNSPIETQYVYRGCGNYDRNQKSKLGSQVEIGLETTIIEHKACVTQYKQKGERNNRSKCTVARDVAAKQKVDLERQP